MDEYVGGLNASKILGVHQRTLYEWDKKKIIETIRTPGGKRLYNVKKYLKSLELNTSNIVQVNNPIINNKMLNKNNYIYARVSSLGQKDDLERQIELLSKTYPNHTLISDIGSGMNMNRKGLRKIIDEAIKGNVNEVVIVYKDRLCRFGYELVEDIINKYSSGKIIILKNNEKKEIKEELVDDVLQIMNIFVAKINGMRKYKKKNKIET
jgi:predicted site-specific integrase-resolvase